MKLALVLFAAATFSNQDKTAYRLPQVTCNALLDQRDNDIERLLAIYDCTTAACHIERVQLYADIETKGAVARAAGEEESTVEATKPTAVGDEE